MESRGDLFGDGRLHCGGRGRPVSSDLTHHYRLLSNTLPGNYVNVRLVD